MDQTTSKGKATVVDSQSDLIALTIEPGLLVATAGGDPVQATITMENRSRIVDRYQMALDGLDPTWYDLSISVVELLPGEKAQIQLAFHPTADFAAQAGAHPYVIKASSKSNPLESSSLGASLEVSPFGLTTLTMSPQYLKGKRSVAQLAFNNRSNSALCYELHASDLEEGLDCLFDPDTVTVPPGEEATGSIAVRPRRRPFFGSLHEYPFVVVAAPPGQEDD
ncbi:MAG: hypothetical protein Q7O66_08405, partial [Dehalococcoidia bacterium]|nr:hypothetical protein [Dehalococcoidia bacterium]